jgi:hypothetical protein
VVVLPTVQPCQISSLVTVHPAVSVPVATVAAVVAVVKVFIAVTYCVVARLIALAAWVHWMVVWGTRWILDLVGMTFGLPIALTAARRSACVRRPNSVPVLDLRSRHGLSLPTSHLGHGAAQT